MGKHTSRHKERQWEHQWHLPQPTCSRVGWNAVRWTTSTVTSNTDYEKDSSTTFSHSGWQLQINCNSPPRISARYIRPSSLLEPAQQQIPFSDILIKLRDWQSSPARPLYEAHGWSRLPVLLSFPIVSAAPLQKQHQISVLSVLKGASSTLFPGQRLPIPIQWNVPAAGGEGLSILHHLFDPEFSGRWLFLTVNLA